MRRAITSVGVLLAVVASTAGRGVFGGEPELPAPDLAALEEAVAAKLREARQLTLERLAEAETDAAAAAEAIGELGRLYQAHELRDAAERCYLRAVELAPGDFRWPYLLGYLNQRNGKLEAAAGFYERALAIVPEVTPALVRLGQVYAAQNRPDDAEETLREALRVDPGSIAAEAALGELLVGRGRHEEAITLLRSALDKEPAANRLYYPLAMAYRATGDVERARELLAQRGTVGVRPADPLIDELERLTVGSRLPLLRGRAAYRAGRYSEAVAAFRQAADADPTSIAARVNLGSALAGAGEVADAIAAFRSALELAPLNQTALFNLGVLLARRGELAAAERHLRRAVELAPDDARALWELAETLRRLDRTEESMTFYERAATLEPPGVAARLAQMELLLQMDRHAEALALVEETRIIAPDSGSLQHALARLLAASPDGSLRDGARALELALQVFASRPNAAHAATVAMAYAEVGDCDEAIAWQGKAIAAARESGDEALADSYRPALSHYESSRPCRYPSLVPPKP